MNILIWGIRSLDYFGQPVQITFDRQRKYNTIVGGLLSLTMYIFTTVVSIKGGQSLFFKVQPKTSFQSLAMTDSPLLNLKDNNMTYIALILDKNKTVFNDPSYFSIEIYKNEIIRKNGSEQYNNFHLPKYDCGNYYDYFVKEGFEEDYKSTQLSLGTCFDIYSKEYIIGGNSIKDYFSNILFRVQRCVNGTDIGVICKPDEKITEKLKGSYFQLFYIDKNIELESFREPFKKYFAKYFILLDPSATKTVDIYYKVVNISTDAGVIFEEEDNFTYDILFDYFTEQIDTSASSAKVLDFYINSSNNMQFYSRYYQKFQDIAASVGGLMQLMTVFGALITSIFNDYEMNVMMFRSLFNFRDSSQKPEKVPDEKLILESLKNIMKKTSNEQEAPSSNNLKENANILRNILNIVKKFDNIKISNNCVYGPAVIAYFCR